MADADPMLRGYGKRDSGHRLSGVTIFDKPALLPPQENRLGQSDYVKYKERETGLEKQRIAEGIAPNIDSASCFPDR